MPQMEVMTNEATEQTKTLDDKQMGGAGLNTMQLGDSKPFINLDNETEKEMDEDTTIEQNNNTDQIKNNNTDKNQGQFEQQLANNNATIEKNQSLIDRLGEMTTKDLFEQIHKLPTEIANQLIEKYTQMGKDKQLSIKEANEIFRQDINKYYSDQNAKLKEENYNLKNSGQFDNRTDEQIRIDEREDTAIQRAAEDYAAAGLNRMGLSGAFAGGGGGGSGSRSDDDDEKRKRRRKEKEENRRARAAEKAREKERITGIVMSLTGMGIKSVGAGAYMHNQNKNFDKKLKADNINEQTKEVYKDMRQKTQHNHEYEMAQLIEQLKNHYR